MRKTRLKNTEIEVSRICLGTGSFGGTGVYRKSGEITQNEANNIVAAALDGGINVFDSAEIYSDGLSEMILGKAIEQRRHEAVIITKAAPVKASPDVPASLTREQLIRSCEGSLRRLKTDYIDIYELHAYPEATRPEDVLETLNELVRQGKVRYIGCSNFAAWQMIKSIVISDSNSWARFVTLEAKYSLLCRELEYELVPACIEHAVNIFAFSPLYGGFLSGKYSRNKPWPNGTRFASESDTGRWNINTDKLFDIVDELEKLSELHGLPVSHIAMNYLLCKNAVSSLIIGVRNISQLNENISLEEQCLTSEDIELLDRISAPKSLYPYMDSQVSKTENQING